jgi:hypothetical protein
MYDTVFNNRTRTEGMADRSELLFDCPTAVSIDPPLSGKISSQPGMRRPMPALGLPRIRFPLHPHAELSGIPDTPVV